jgi:hypothetical protein
MALGPAMLRWAASSSGAWLNDRRELSIMDGLEAFDTSRM